MPMSANCTCKLCKLWLSWNIERIKSGLCVYFARSRFKMEIPRPCLGVEEAKGVVDEECPCGALKFVDARHCELVPSPLLTRPPEGEIAKLPSSVYLARVWSI